MTTKSYYFCFHADVNECVADSNGCNQSCINTDGSFHCICDDGYALSEDRRTCRDIDECLMNVHGCQQVCMNTAGGFRCECNPGFQLNLDNNTCSGICCEFRVPFMYVIEITN